LIHSAFSQHYRHFPGIGPFLKPFPVFQRLTAGPIVKRFFISGASISKMAQETKKIPSADLIGQKEFVHYGY